jgi:hypothetical protein
MNTALSSPGCQLVSITNPAFFRLSSNSDLENTVTDGRNGNHLNSGATYLKKVDISAMQGLLETNTPPGFNSE